VIEVCAAGAAELLLGRVGYIGLGSLRQVASVAATAAATTKAPIQINFVRMGSSSGAAR
jgi:hypothetical protein